MSARTTMHALLSALVSVIAHATCLLLGVNSAGAAEEAKPLKWGGIPQAIVVRTTENVTEGGWVWILNKAKEAGISRIYLLVKQEENEFLSERTKRTLKSGELLVSLPDEKTAEGWENSDWLNEMLVRAHADGIEIFAWFPVFQDAMMAQDFPAHVYAGSTKEAFVDPAIEAVRARQENLIRKVVSAYAFDGVALDWIRYNARNDGSKGPLADRFELMTGKHWSAELMADPLQRAIWDDLRAATVADWIKNLTATFRQQKPTLKWGAFVLPWQFKEVAQSYRRLGDAGLDFLQPMIYWSDWKETPDWTKDVLRGGPYWLAGNTAFWPTFDINGAESKILDGLAHLSSFRLAGHSWYNDSDWSEADFAKLNQIGAKWAKSGAPIVEASKDIVLDPPVPPAQKAGHRLEPAAFPANANVWTAVCLAELYRLGAIDDTDKVVPVLAFHRFATGDAGSGKSDWINSTAYLDALMNFLKETGFNVVPVSHLQAYMISENPAVLPKRPLVLTIDDGSSTILDHFHARALKHGFPYSVSLITSLVKDQSTGEIMKDEINDVMLTVSQSRQLLATGTVELLSHTHNLHFFGTVDETGKETGPAMTTRLWLKDRGRQETSVEWQHRVFSDLVRSRAELRKIGVAGPALLTWPYGDFDETTKALATEAGFNGFLDFTKDGFAAPRFGNDSINRISVVRADEKVPLHLPTDATERQRWWLGFLKWSRKTESPELIDAALERLEGQQKSHPEAEISRASLDALRGWPDAAKVRIDALKRDYSDDAAVQASIAEFLENYEQVF